LGPIQAQIPLIHRFARPALGPLVLSRAMHALNTLFAYFKKHRVVAHLAFWLAILLFSIGRNDFGAGDWAGTPSVVYALALLLTQVPATYFLAYIGLPRFLTRKQYVSSLGLLLGVAYGISVLSRVVIVYGAEPVLARLDRTFLAPKQDSLASIATELYKLFHVYLFNNFSVACIFLVIKLLLMQQASQQQAIAVEKEKVSSELKLLKSQLNPHFLFNTLNNIYSLAIQNSPQTADSIGRLAGILDYILYRATLPFVPVQEELEIIDAYIKLEKLRYSERLVVTFKQEVQSTILIAPLLLVSLVENAFKHGASEDMGFPEIHIQTSAAANVFLFEIKNTIVGKAKADGKDKIGLLNISKQLELLYGAKQHLEITSNDAYFFLKLRIQQ
jgi:sensor histidine kinase YesM